MFNDRFPRHTPENIRKREAEQEEGRADDKQERDIFVQKANQNKPHNARVNNFLDQSFNEIIDRLANEGDILSEHDISRQLVEISSFIESESKGGHLTQGEFEGIWEALYQFFVKILEQERGNEVFSKILKTYGNVILNTEYSIYMLTALNAVLKDKKELIGDDDYIEFCINVFEGEKIHSIDFAYDAQLSIPFDLIDDPGHRDENRKKILDFISGSAERLERDTALNLKVISFIGKIAKAELANGGYYPEINGYIGYLKDQMESDKYLVRINAQETLNEINSDIQYVEGLANCVIHDDFGYIEKLEKKQINPKHDQSEGLRREATSDYYGAFSDYDEEYYEIHKKSKKYRSAEGYSAKKIFRNWKKYPEGDKARYFNEIFGKKLNFTWPEQNIIYDNELDGGSGMLIRAKISKEYIGQYFRSDGILCVLEKDGKQIETKELMNDFFKRDKMIASPLSLSEVADNNYLFLNFSSLPVRERIEGDFNINMDDLTFNEQRQLFAFISGLSSDKFEKVKSFINVSSGNTERVTRARTFLALESGEEMGDKILSIGESLQNSPEIADKLFSEYAKLIDSVNSAVEEITSLYKEIFHDKQFDKDSLERTILIRSSDLLSEAEILLSAADDEKKEKIIKNLIDDLAKDQDVRRKQMDEFRKIGTNLNNNYSELTRSIFEKDIFASYDRARQGEIGALLADRQLEQFQRMIDNMNQGQHSQEDFDLLYKDFLRKEKKYDEQRIKGLIKHYKSLYTLTDGDIENVRRDVERDAAEYKKEAINQIKAHTEGRPDSLRFREALIREVERQAELMVENGVNQIIEMAESSPEVQPFKEVYEPLVKKLQNLLLYQKNFEKKFDEIIYGQGFSDFPQELKEHVSYKVFQKYDEISSLAKKSKEELRLLFKDDRPITEEELDKISRGILKKANTTLESYTNKIIAGEEIDEQSIIEELRDYQRDQILYSYIVKGVEGIKFDDLKDATFERTTTGKKASQKVISQVRKRLRDGEFPYIDSTELQEAIGEQDQRLSDEESRSVDEIIQMVRIYSNNYKDKPALQEKLIAGFLEKLQEGGDNVVLYIFKKKNEEGKDEIMAFNRFDRVSDDRRYFGSFNANPALGGTAIGHALLKASLEEEDAQAEEIEADCEPEKAISSNYIENYNFIVRKILADYGETGITAFNIIRRDENKKFYYRDYTKEDLIAEYEKNFAGNSYPQGEKYIILKFDTSDGKKLKNENQLNAMLAEAGRLVNDGGYVMTRYFFGKNQKEVFCAFERQA